MIPSSKIKQVYVRAVHAVARRTRRWGLLTRIEKNGGSRARLWLRSLFAIHDIDDMLHLDLPWWTFGAIDEVERFLSCRPGARVFEYGSGASTIWLARRAGRVTSIEHDPVWYSIVRKRLAEYSNAKILLVPPEPALLRPSEYGSQRVGFEKMDFRAYATAIDSCCGPYDLIVVDGRARPACLVHALAHLAAGGILLFDNSGRNRYRAALESSSCRIQRFRGLAPALPVPDETALLSRVVPEG